MSRPATSRLKCNPPLGWMPVLQFVPPAELQIDAGYQRSIEAKDSQSLIRRIAQHWNWDLCQPLVVSRRRGENGESYFVIDGQHRLAAAKLRGDIAQLPCVVNEYPNAADEAASFVHLNQQRRPLTKIDLFKAALASEDPEAIAIDAAMRDAGLTLAPHSNATAWKPGQVANVGGIERAWRRHGAKIASEALLCLATGFAGEVQRYAGTLFPGIVAVCAGEMKGDKEFTPDRFARFTAMLGSRGQDKLREDVVMEMASEPQLGRVGAAVRIVREMWSPELKRQREAMQRAFGGTRSETPGAVAFEGDSEGLAWCDQCDRRVDHEHAGACTSPFCSLRKVA